MSREYLYRSSQCSSVRTISSKTQGALDANLEDRPELAPHMSVASFFSATNGILLSPHLLEDIMATLSAEDGSFGSYIDACHFKQVVGVYFVAIDRICSHTFWAWLVSHPLFSACLLLGTCFLTTCSHKRIRLLTRVYGSFAWFRYYPLIHLREQSSTKQLSVQRSRVRKCVSNRSCALTNVLVRCLDPVLAMHKAVSASEQGARPDTRSHSEGGETYGCRENRHWLC